jgi:hypothetical protein
MEGTAKCGSTCSGVFRQKLPTRSPVAIPKRRKEAAKHWTRSATRWYVVWQTHSPSNTAARLSAKMATREGIWTGP